MPAIKQRITELEQRLLPTQTTPYIFLVGDDRETAQADWETANKQPFPANRPCVLFSIIKPNRREDVTGCKIGESI